MAKTQIMVVEDEIIVAEDVKRTLQKMGYAVSAVVSSGEEALKKAEEYKPDLVLMDIVLRGEMDGIDAAKQIRYRLNIPVVYLTAYADEKTLERAKITEPFGYIIKPFENRELQSNIEMALYKSQMEKKLKENEEWLSTTLRSIGDAAIATDTAGNVTFINPVAQSLTGWKQEDAVGKPLKKVFNIISEKTGKKVENPVTRVIRVGIVVGLANHTILIAKDGTKIPIDDSGAPIRDDKGNIIGVILVFHDITERKKTEQVLQESEERLRTVIEASLDAIVAVNDQGNIMLFNPAAEELFLYSPDEVLNKPVRILQREDVAEIHQKRLERFLSRGVGQCGHIGRHVERTFKRKDGTHFEAEVAMSGGRSNGLRLVVVSIRDITERKWAEEELLLLQRINNLINAGVGQEEVFETITDSVRLLYNYDSVAIQLLNKDRKNLIVKSYSADPKVAEKIEKLIGLTITGYETPLYEGSMLKEIIDTKKPVITDDIIWVLKSYTDRKSLQSMAKTVAKLTKARWGIGVPLLAGDRLVGIIGCGSIEKPTDADIQRLASFGAQAGLAIDKTQGTREIEESEKKYSTLVEKGNDGIVIIQDSLLKFVNTKTLEITGFSMEEALGKPFIDFVSPEYRELVMDRYKKRISGEKVPHSYEIEILSKDGRKIPVEINASVIEYEAKPADMAILRDITERKKSEEVLRDTKAFLDNIIQSAPDAIITVDLNDKILTFSPSAEAMFDYKSEDIIGKSVLKLYPKRQRKKRKKWKEKLLKEGRLDRVRTKQLKADGRTFDVSLSMALLKDSEGKAIGIVGVSHDITKELKAERDLKKAYKELKHLDRLKDEFLQNVTHELRTPITAMLTTNRVIRDTIEDDGLKELLEINERSTWRLNRLVGDLLDASSIERGTKELRLEPLDIKDLINAAISDIESYASKRKLEINFSAEKGIPRVVVDRDSVYRVLLNLMNNAVKFNREGGRILVNVSQNNGQVVVSVEDSGIGIDKNNREKVFDRFYQIDGSKTRKFQGTGIGLALTKKLIEMHGGMIWVESEPGEWTRFTFTLPVGR